MTGTLTPAGDAAPTTTVEPIRGRTRITGKAIASLASAATARAFGVPADAVRATVSDDAGALALSCQSPIATPPLSSRPTRPVVARIEAARTEIAEEVMTLAGRQVGRVVIDVTGVVTRAPERVR